MKFAPLNIVLLCPSIPLLFLWRGLVVVFFYYVLWARVSLALLMLWIHRSRVSIVLVSKFLLDLTAYR